jgi:hypothetical protein
MALSLTRTALSSTSNRPGSRIDRIGTWPKRPTNALQGSGTNGLDHEAREERLRRRKRRESDVCGDRLASWSLPNFPSISSEPVRRATSGLIGVLLLNMLTP